MSDEFTNHENETDNPYQQSYGQPQDNPYQGQTYGQQQSNPYQQSYGQPQGNNFQQYGNNQYYGQAPQKGDSIGFGIASLVLGVISIFLFACCVNYIMAILAIVFGILQIVKNESKGMAIAGIITASISIILSTILWIAAGNAQKNGNLQDFLNRYYNENGNEFNFDPDDYDDDEDYDDLYDRLMDELEKDRDEL